MVKQFSRKQNQVSLYFFFQGIAQNVTWNQHTRWYISAPPKLLKIDSASHIKKYRKKSKIHDEPIVPNSTYIKFIFSWLLIEEI